MDGRVGGAPARGGARYADLRDGGRALATALPRSLVPEGAIVLGIVRGGVPLAREFGDAHATPVDVVVLRAILQCGPGRVAGAVTVAGTLVLDDELRPPGLSVRTIEHLVVAEALAALASRTTVCRGPRSPVEIAGRTVVLVDNAVRTGTTMRAAVGAVRRLGPARIIAAIPVASPDGLALVKTLADEVVCLAMPEPFGNAALWYRRFDVPDDDAISAYLTEPR